MSRALQIALVLLFAAPAFVAAEEQKIPSPYLCTVPTFIRLVGIGPSGPDPSGSFVVVTRDIANNPLPNEQVVIDFSQCGDVRLAEAATPGQFVDCPSHTVKGFTDDTGTITFDIVGAGTNLGASAGEGLGCANIYAEGVLLRHATVCIYDEDGAVRSPGMGITDLYSFLRDLGSGSYFGRSDYDWNQRLDVADLSVFLHCMGMGGSAAGSSAGYCP